MATTTAKLTGLPKVTPTSISEIGNNRGKNRSPSQLTVVNHRRFPRIVTSALSSTGFSPSIEIPDIKFYRSKTEFNIFDNRLFSIFLNDPTGQGKLHKFWLRMVLRDDDGVIGDKFEGFWLDSAELLRQANDGVQGFEITNNIAHLTKRVCGCLVEHIDSWVCGYSFVTYVESDDKFHSELDKLEPVLSQHARGESMETAVRSAELILKIGVYGNICDRDIHSRDDLVDQLQQLNALEGKDRILYILPVCSNEFVSKEKVDQMEDYAHICLGKFR